MSGLRLLPLGVGDAFTERYFTQCLAVESEGAWLLVDCPHPIRRMIREGAAASGVDLDAGRIAGVALTHLHADHSSGLEGLAYYSFFHGRRRLRLIVHPDVAARLWEGHLAASMDQLMERVGEAPRPRRLDDYIEVIPVEEGGAASLGPFSIECRRTIHHIPTTAFRIRAGDRSLAVSGDTAFDPSLIEWLAAADLIIHETNAGVHTPYERLAALPADLRRRMRLIHFPDDFDLAGSAIEPLQQGRVYPV